MRVTLKQIANITGVSRSTDVKIKEVIDKAAEKNIPVVTFNYNGQTA